MLFIVNYIQKHDTEETEARNQEVFKNWTLYVVKSIRTNELVA